MELFEIRRRNGVLEVGRGRFGRVVHAATRFLFWFPIGLLGISFVFLPDYLGQYREQSAQAGAFWWVMVGVAAFIAAIGAFVRFSRRDVWGFDADEGVVVFRARPMIGPSAEASVELDRLQSIDVRSRSWPGKSAVELSIRGRRTETLAETRLGAARLEGVVEALRAFVDEHEVAVDFREDATG